MMHLLEALRPSAAKITYACTAAPSALAEEFESLDIEQQLIKVNDPDFDSFVSGLNPQLVIFDRYVSEEQFGWRVAECCPEAMRILNTEDLHGLRRGRQLALGEGEPFSLSYFHNDVAKRELASLLRCDLSLIVSSFEMNWLTDICNLSEKVLHYYPLQVNEVQTIESFPTFEERHGYVWIGNFKHPPNHDAVEFLRTTIWPEIRRRDAEACIRIYGAYMPEKLRKWHDRNNGFLIEGFAENSDQVMQSARVCLAPLRFGAGLKGKLIDAMKNATPVMTTAIGAEGLFKNSRMTEDSPEEFAEKAVSLYKDEQNWHEASASGLEMLRTNFTREKHANSLIDRLLVVYDGLRSHRTSHVLNAVMQHHTLSSSKYMSKWIEAKNR